LRNDCNPSNSSEIAKKIRVFHQPYFWKTARLLERFTPAEQAVIAIANSEQKTNVVRKAIA